MPSENELAPPHYQPIQAWQEMYQAINHKADTLKKFFEQPNLYKISDIEDLHNKIFQISDTYTCLEKSHNVKIYYLDKSQHTTENFIGFKTKVTSTSQPIKMVTLTYNFLIKHPQTTNPHSYRISIDIESSLAHYENMLSSNKFTFCIHGLEKISGAVAIEYVEYAIAQNFMNIISDWFQNRSTFMPSSAFLMYLRKKSHHIPFISRNLFTLLYAYFVYKLLIHCGYYNNLYDFSIFLIFSLTTAVLIREIAQKATVALERNIDRLNFNSCIDITSGDKELIQKFRKRNKTNLWNAIFNFSIQIIIGVASTIVASFLLN
jgi:hypothetical protein